MSSFPDLLILRHLGARTHATAAEVGVACRMMAAEVRARLVSLESRRLVAGRNDSIASLRAPRRVYHAITEGRRAAGVSDVRSTPSTV